MKKLQTKDLIWEIVFGLVFVAGLIFVIVKCRQGLANCDEAFYLTIPLRMCQGDGLLAQEWHVSQLSGFLLYPIMKIYLAVSPSTDGILLTFRYIFVAFQGLIAVFLYYRLRRINKYGAGLASVCFLIFAPYGLMALSYNSMGIGLMTVATVIILTMKKAPRIQSIIAGLAFAGAVLCCPYLLIVYVLYTTAAIVLAIRKKLSIKTWVFFTIGAGALAAVFAVYVLSHAGIQEIIRNINYILADTDHENSGILGSVKIYIKAVLAINIMTKISYVLLLLTALVALIDRKRKNHGAIYLAVGTILTIAAVVALTVHEGILNYILFPANVFAIICIVINWNSITRKIFFGVWVPGMIYTFCIHLSSNQLLHAISLASMTALIGSIMMIAVTAKEYANGADWKTVTAKVSAIALAVILLGCEGYLRYVTVFWEDTENIQPYQQEISVEKGLYISTTSEIHYGNSLLVKEYIEENHPDIKVAAFITGYSWLYLMFPEVEMGANSAWILNLDGTIHADALEREVEYYKLYPDKVPDLVYIEENYMYAMDYFKSVALYKEEPLDIGGVILSKVTKTASMEF